MMPVWSQNHIKHQTFAALISSLRVLQRVWKPKKPKQCDCLSGSGYLPPHPIPETQSLMENTDASPFISQDHPSQTARGHRIHGPLDTLEVSRRERSGKSSPFIFPYPAEKNNTGLFCVSEESSCVFSWGSVTSHWDVSGNNSFIIREGSYDYRLLYYTVSQRDSESNDGMTTALFSLLVQDDVKLNDLYLCS